MVGDAEKRVLVGIPNQLFFGINRDPPPPPEDFGGRRENARTTKTKRTELEINKTNKGV